MRKLIILLIFPFLTLQLYAQETELFGYFEPQIMGFKLKNEFLQLSSNKLRIDLKADFSDRASFGANFDYITYHGKVIFQMLDFLPASVTKDIPDSLWYLYTLPFKDRNFLDNAYLRMSFKYADLTIGKQQISLGAGYAWNPTDIFNFKDVLDPTYEQPGHNAVRLDIPIGLKYKMLFIYSPENNWRNSAKLIQFKGGFRHFDYSLIAIERNWIFYNYYTFQPIIQKRNLFGGDFAGEIFGAGIWGEIAYNRMEITENYWESVFGIDYTLDSGTYIMSEYYRNTSGKTDYKKYDLNDWIRYISAETKTISRDQFYFYINHPTTDLLNTGCSVIFNLNDESIAVVPSVVYNIFENVDLTFFGNFYIGRSGTTYASNMGNGGLARARVYF